MMTLLLGALLGQQQQQVALDAGGPATGGAGNAGGAGSAPAERMSRLIQADLVDDVNGLISEDNAQDNADLQNSLSAIAADEEGQILLQQAEARGVKIQVGNLPPNVNGQFDPNTNTITVKDPNNIKTLAHELVHAATPENGNSLAEEGAADEVGYRIAERIAGRDLDGRNDQQANFAKRELYTLRTAGGQQNNNIAGVLSSMGIRLSTTA